LQCGQIGNHPKDILAKFDYMLVMKIGKKYLLNSWLTIGTHHKKFVIWFFFQNLANWVIIFMEILSTC
jgi:hypothetical protein